MTEPTMKIHFFGIESNSVAYATLCKTLYDTTKSHHRGFWLQTEDGDKPLEKVHKKLEALIKKYENEPLTAFKVINDIREILDERI